MKVKSGDWKRNGVKLEKDKGRERELELEQGQRWDEYRFRDVG